MSRTDTWDDIDAELDKLKALSLDYDPDAGSTVNDLEHFRGYSTVHVPTGYTMGEFDFQQDLALDDYGTPQYTNYEYIPQAPQNLVQQSHTGSLGTNGPYQPSRSNVQALTKRFEDIEYAASGELIPPLGDMLELVDDAKIHKAYSAIRSNMGSAPKSASPAAPATYKSPAANSFNHPVPLPFEFSQPQQPQQAQQPRQSFQPLQQQRKPQYLQQSQAQQSQPQHPQQQQQPQHTSMPPGPKQHQPPTCRQSTMPVLPPLTLTQWRIPQCAALVKHVQLQLQEILQDAIYVKKLEFYRILPNAEVREMEEKRVNEILKSTVGKLRTVKEISAVIARINSGDRAHNSMQSEITNSVDVSVSSTVKMLRTVLNIFAFKASPEQFDSEFQPFLTNVRQLIQLLPKLHWKTGQEVFYLF